jgi:hypothetical protein
MTRYLLLFGSYGLAFVGRPFWREDGSVFCICCCPLPAQSFSGPSPLVLVTIFYCLRFETSLFVASYDSQGHGGGIRPRFHTGLSRENRLPLLYSLGSDHVENTVLNNSFFEQFLHCCWYVGKLSPSIGTLVHQAVHMQWIVLKWFCHSIITFNSPLK